MSEVIFEVESEDGEDEFWEKFEEYCKTKGWEIYDVSDMETEWYALPSATSGHGIGVQEIIVRDKSGREITLARIRENYYGSITEKVKVIAEGVME